MKIKTFPINMWDKIGSRSSPPIKRTWKLDVVCGTLEDLNLSGCGAKLTLGRRDFYKQLHFGLVGQESYWWRCPCCGAENPLDTSTLEINNGAVLKKDYLIRIRDSIVAELLTNKEFREGINYEPAGQYIRSLGLEVDDSLIPSSLLSTHIIGEA